MPLLLSQVQLSFFLPFSFRPTTPTISILNPILLLPLSPFVPLNESLNARGIFSVLRCCAVTTNHDFWIQPALSHCQFNRICSIWLQSHSHNPLRRNYLQLLFFRNVDMANLTGICQYPFMQEDLFPKTGGCRFSPLLHIDRRNLGLTTMVCAYSCWRTILRDSDQPSRSCIVLFALSSCSMEIWW